MAFCLQLLPLLPEARFRLLHHPMGLNQEAGERDLHRLREEVPPVYHLQHVLLCGLGAGARSLCDLRCGCPRRRRSLLYSRLCRGGLRRGS
jgi:hypothetical protein